MKVGNLVRRKPHAITNQPEILGLVTEMGPDTTHGEFIIRVAFIDPHGEPPHHGQHWRNASHFEVVS